MNRDAHFAIKYFRMRMNGANIRPFVRRKRDSKSSGVKNVSSRRTSLVTKTVTTREFIRITKISEDDEKGKDSPSDLETQYSRSMDKIIGVGDSDADESSYEDDPRKESATGDGTADQGKMTRRWHRK